MRAFGCGNYSGHAVFFEIYDSVWFFDLLFWNPRYMFTVWILADRTGRNRSFGKYRILSNLFGFIWRMEFSEVNFLH